MKTRSILTFILAALALCSCKGTWVMYDTDQKDRIYFADGYDSYGSVIPSQQDISRLHTESFSLIVEDEIEVTARVRLLGTPSGQDRTFKVEYTSAAPGETLQLGNETYPVISGTPGEDFTVSDLIMPAGQTQATLTLTLHRTPKMLEGSYVRVGVRLAENEFFTPLAADSTSTGTPAQSPEFYVYVNDGEPACPSWWRYANNARYPLGWSCYLGNFFPEKYRRFLSLFKETQQTAPAFYETIVEMYGENLEEAPVNFFRSQYPNAWARYVFMPLYNYYKAYFEAHPDDPNFELIGTSSVVINSFIGWGDPMDGTYGFFN